VDTVYKMHPGYSEKASTLFTFDAGAPEDLPDALRGERWSFVQLPLSMLEQVGRDVFIGGVGRGGEGCCMTMYLYAKVDLHGLVAAPALLRPCACRCAAHIAVNTLHINIVPLRSLALLPRNSLTLRLGALLALCLTWGYWGWGWGKTH
jgi:hypothetical protein